MRTETPPSDLSARLAEAKFRRLYAEHGRDLLAYALRRTPDPEDAADILAETFLVAWRRAADVPAGADARLWLFGVARRVLANQQRGERRRVRLSEKLRAEVSEQMDQVDDWGRDGSGVIAALERLDSSDREVLRLTAWEELAPADVGKVLGVSSVTVRSRLHRARRRLRRELEGEGR